MPTIHSTIGIRKCWRRQVRGCELPIANKMIGKRIVDISLAASEVLQLSIRPSLENSLPV
jgi:hypothetical protein